MPDPSKLRMDNTYFTDEKELWVDVVFRYATSFHEQHGTVSDRLLQVTADSVLQSAD